MKSLLRQKISKSLVFSVVSTLISVIGGQALIGASPVYALAPSSAPTLSSATPQSGTSAGSMTGVVTLTWTSVSGATGYIATASPGGQTCSVSSGSTLTCDITGLNLATEYSFTVAATNSSGTGPSSNAVLAITAATFDSCSQTTASCGVGNGTPPSTNVFNYLQVRTDGNWVAVTESKNGSVAYAAKSPGGIYKSTDYGENWSLLNVAGTTNLSWTGLSTNTDGSILFASAGTSGLWLSTDGGSSFSTINSSSYNWLRVAMDWSATHLFAAVTGDATSSNNGLYYATSSNYSSWTKNTNYSPVGSISQIATNKGSGQYVVISETNTKLVDISSYGTGSPTTFNAPNNIFDGINPTNKTYGGVAINDDGSVVYSSSYRVVAKGNAQSPSTALTQVYYSGNLPTYYQGSVSSDGTIASFISTSNPVVTKDSFAQGISNYANEGEWGMANLNNQAWDSLSGTGLVHIIVSNTSGSGGGIWRGVIAPTVSSVTLGPPGVNGVSTATVTWSHTYASTNTSSISGYSVVSIPSGLSCSVTGSSATSCTVSGLVPGGLYEFAVVSNYANGDTGFWALPSTPLRIATLSACITTLSTSGNYHFVTFTGTGACTWSVPSGVNAVDVLAVGGGGAGSPGEPGGWWGSGGGGGQVVTQLSVAVASGSTQNVVVGVGGSAITACGASCATLPTSANNGSVSSFSNLVTANGGMSPLNLNSNGGANGDGNAGATPTSAALVGGGGVGAAAGTNASYENGGAGTASLLTGSSTYGGGGGGSGVSGCGTTTAGGGTCHNAGTANTGGGGGAGDGATPSGAGGSGLVVLRYTITTSLTITSTTNASSYAYGSSITFGSSFSGLVGSDTATITNTFTSTGGYNSTTAPTAVGTYTLTPSAASFTTGSASNYTISYVAKTFTITATAPGSPTAVSATTSTTGTSSSASVSFTAPANTGGASDTYTVTATPVGGGSPISANCSSSPCTITGLSPNTAYTFTATANNTAGSSAPSTPTASITTPGATATISASTPSSGSTAGGTNITITGTNFVAGASVTVGGVACLNVVVVSSTQITCTTPTGTAGPATISVSDPGGAAATLPNGFTYIAPPNAPTSVTVTAGNTQASVSFTPASSGGTPSSYQVTATPSGGGSAVVVSCLASPCSVTGLTNGTSYSINVAAVNSVDSSTATSAPAPVIPLPFTVTYNLNGGSGTTPPNQNYNLGDPAINLPSAAAFSFTGYTFLGWADSGTVTVLSSPFTPTKSTTLFAQWVGNTYSIAFNSNGAASGSIASTTYTTGTSPLVLPSGSALSNPGYNFAGWSTTPGGSPIANPSSYTTASNQTLYALWTPKVININYVPGSIGGTAPTLTLIPSNTTANYASSYTIGGPVDSQTVVSGNTYAFVGWQIGSTTYQPGQSIIVGLGPTITVTAQWIQLLLVHYVLNGGTGSYVDSLTATGTTIVVGSAPTRVGYSFNGWLTQSNNPASPGGNFVVDGSNFIFYAQWNPITYTINFITSTANTSGSASLTGTIGQTVSLNSGSGFSSTNGLIFTGWLETSTSYAASQNYVIDSAATGITSITMVAQWIMPQFLLSYNLNGGSGVTPSSLLVSQGASTPTASDSGLSLTGYSFNGWLNGSTLVAATSSVTMPASNLTLVAQWKILPPSAPVVVVTPADGALTISVTPGASGGVPSSYSVTLSNSATCSIIAPATSCSIFGLTNGIPLSASVTATNSTGSSAPATASGTPVGLPSLQSVAPSSGSTVGGTTVTLSGVNFAIGTTVSIGGVACLSISVTSSTQLTCVTPPGAAGSVNVVVTNAGAGSSTITNGFTYVAPPSSPTGVSATPGNGQATISFTPGSTGGAASSYNVVATPPSPGTPISITCTTSPCNFPGLTNGVPYTFAVTASNAAGPSAPSTSSSAVTPADVPGAPTSVSATASTPGSTSTATVSFTAPTSNGGSPINGYTVTATPTSGGSPVVASCATSPCSVPGLAPSASYTFSVVATNGVGPGPSSASSTPVLTPAAAPSAPPAGGGGVPIPPAPTPTSTQIPPIDGAATVASPAIVNLLPALASKTGGTATLCIVDSSGNCTTNLSVPGAGVAALNTTTGVLQFTAAPNFVGQVTPIRVTSTDPAGNKISTSVLITVPGAPQLIAPTSIRVQSGAPASFPYQANAGTGATIAPNSIQLIDPVTGSPTSSITVAGVGTWSIDIATGKVSFNPEAGSIATSASVSLIASDNFGQKTTVTTTLIFVNNSTQQTLPTNNPSATPSAPPGSIQTGSTNKNGSGINGKGQAGSNTGNSSSSKTGGAAGANGVDAGSANTGGTSTSAASAASAASDQKAYGDGATTQPNTRFIRIFFTMSSWFVDAPQLKRISNFVQAVMTLKGPLTVTVQGYVQPTPLNPIPPALLSKNRAKSVMVALKRAGLLGKYSIKGMGLAKINAPSSRYALVIVHYQP